MNQISNVRTIRREVEWVSGSKIIDKVECYKSKVAYINLENIIKHLKNLTMTTNWFLYDDITGELLASKFPETKQQQAKRLYKQFNSYAKVAKELGVHPTTAKKWVTEND